MSTSEITLEKVIQHIETLKVLELKDWVDGFEKHFGVSAAPVAVAGAAAGPAAAVEEQTSFTVTLKSSWRQKNPSD